MADGFYVYAHRRLDTGDIFYIGKGSKKRLLDDKNRNQHWLNIAMKHGFKAEILMTFKEEQCAFSFETAIIRMIGLGNLCNYSEGGRGASGHKRSKETKEKLSKIKKGVPLKQEHRKKIAERMKSFETRSLISSKLMSKDVNKKLVDSAKRQFSSDEKKAKHSRACGAKEVVRSDGVVFGSASEAGRKMTEELGRKCAHQNIQRACKIGYRAFGYSWGYK